MFTSYIIITYKLKFSTITQKFYQLWRWRVDLVFLRNANRSRKLLRLLNGRLLPILFSYQLPLLVVKLCLCVLESVELLLASQPFSVFCSHTLNNPGDISVPSSVQNNLSVFPSLSPRYFFWFSHHSSYSFR